MKLQNNPTQGRGLLHPENSNADIYTSGLIADGVNKNALVVPEVFPAGKEPVTTSQAIARYFGRDHDKVVNRIENLDCSAGFLTRNFRRVKFEHGQKGSAGMILRREEIKKLRPALCLVGERSQLSLPGVSHE